MFPDYLLKIQNIITNNCNNIFMDSCSENEYIAAQLSMLLYLKTKIDICNEMCQF